MRSCCQRSPRWRANAARYSCRAANAAAAWEDRRRGESVAVLGAASAPVDLCGHVLEALFAEHHECQHLRSRKQARLVARQPSRQTRKGAGRQPVSAPGAALHPVQRARARTHARTHNRAHAGTDTQGRHCAERDPVRAGMGLADRPSCRWPPSRACAKHQQRPAAPASDAAHATAAAAPAIAPSVSLRGLHLRMARL